MVARIAIHPFRVRLALLVAACGAALFAWLPVTPSWQVRLLFAPLCHQKIERSLTLFGETMAVCSRCSGLYFGAALAVMLAALAPRALVWPRGAWFLAALAPTAADALLPWVGLPQLALLPRHVVAWPAGLAAGWFFALGIAAVAASSNHVRLDESVEGVDG